ncbi:fam-l protein [Plasmodium malariae]|uniref:Fam-l protein n=1 Tax=Plasmodium malariae TaxID=5858 RepID=A0A1D3RH84_PLAMA|nr:fam-l protein [Plasmodium malariae]SCN44522.1 fam-l protein [Plasmodium malariae]
MEQEKKALLLVNFLGFILLSWKYHFNSDNMFSITLDEGCKLKKKLETRNCRLLGKHEHLKDSNVVNINKGIEYIGLNNIKDIHNNEERIKKKKKQPNGSSPRCTRGYKKDTKNKTCTFNAKKYSHMEKKIFKELDYEDFLKNNRTISDKLYKKIILKKCRLRLALPLLLFLLLSLGLILDFSFNCGLTRGLYKLLSYSLSSQEMMKFHNYLKSNVSSFFKYSVPKDNSSTTDFYITPFFDFLIYCVVFFILGISIISGIIYYHKKVIKYEKIKFRKR